MLTETDIKKFQAIYQSEFGVSISAEEAREKGTKLFVLMSHIYKPIPESGLLVKEPKSTGSV